MTHDPNDPEILKAALANALDSRDEAVKREKRRTDELARLRGILNEEERRRSDAQDQNRALVEALDSALRRVEELTMAITHQLNVAPKSGVHARLCAALKDVNHTEAKARAALDQSGKGARS